MGVVNRQSGYETAGGAGGEQVLHVLPLPAHICHRELGASLGDTESLPSRNS